MAWYAAHIIMNVEFKDGKQNILPIWENIILIEAKTEKLAYEIAVTRGKETEGDSSGTFRWEDRPANWVFKGIRKIISCENETEQPQSGTEISYLEYNVSNLIDLEKLMLGDESINICFID